MKQLRLILTFFSIAVSIYAKSDPYIDADSIQTVCQADTDHKTNIFSAPVFKFIIPAVFISYGVLSQVAKPLQQLDENIDKEVNKHFTKHRSFDDYLQYVPVTAIYGLDFIGVKPKNNLRDRTFVVITSHLIMGGTVQAVKMTAGIERPDGSNHRSFPSGHTATAFTGAHILFKEYKDITPWIGITGYAVATTVGTMRILNRKHWLSDVVTGAGIGILSAEIGYMLLPVFHNIIGLEQNQSSLAIAPVFGNNQYGLAIAYVF